MFPFFETKTVVVLNSVVKIKKLSKIVHEYKISSWIGPKQFSFWEKFSLSFIYKKVNI